MKFCVLSSGSKGNSTLIETNKTKILIDLGTSCKYVEETLEGLNVNPAEIDAILVTHVHADHIKGLKVFIKKYNPLIYVTEKLLPFLKEILDKFSYEIYDNRMAIINDIVVTSIETSHDAEESMGFLIRSEEKSIVYLTDTGYINSKYHDIIKNKNIYIIESNHDVKMLREGPYPYHLQQRVISDKGHLSNEQASNYLAKFIGPKTKKIVFAHISEKNNTPEKVIETFNKIKEKNNIKFDDYLLAKQNEPTELIEV